MNLIDTHTLIQNMPKEEMFPYSYISSGIYARMHFLIISVGLKLASSVDILHNTSILVSRPAGSWQHKVVVVVVVVAVAVVVAVCQTRRVLPPCPYQYHGSMGHHVG
jgi:hypothetical protein